MESSGFQACLLSLKRGGRTLLDGVSLALAAGEVVAVVGPNGAGKSSLLRLLSGDLRPDGGGILFRGRPLPAWKRRDLARCRAVLPQHSGLLFPFPVREVVAMGRAPHGAGIETERDRIAIREAMGAADVGHLEGRAYDTLSGGERQRVQLARVLAQVWPAGEGDRFLLLDEPTASLDLSHQHAVLRAARGFARHGAGVLVVLHDLNLAARYADRVVVLHQGRVVADDVPEQALTPGRIQAVFSLRMAWVDVLGTGPVLVYIGP